MIHINYYQASSNVSYNLKKRKNVTLIIWQVVTYFYFFKPKAPINCFAIFYKKQIIFLRSMTYYISSHWLPWMVTVVISFVMSQYLNQIFLIQNGVQVHYSYHIKYNKSYIVTVTKEYRMNKTNEKAYQLSTVKTSIPTHGNDLLTPIQLKDFGKYPMNRKNSLLFIIHRV